ncbi:hypothetical protein EV363DRAFT_1319320 [Boletus edulis]|nr:hypothetical protein EV363DRAFT_1319320 [Boletus edulis]
MCYWRRVQNTYKRCGHAYDLPDQMIECDNQHCRFSPTHPSTCVPPVCTETCWQFRQFPQQYTPQIDAFCPVCEERRRG